MKESLEKEKVVGSGDGKLIDLSVDSGLHEEEGRESEGRESDGLSDIGKIRALR